MAFGRRVYMEKNPIPVVCIIIERRRGNRTEILIQQRWKPESDPNYVGFYEIPGGKILAGETVEQAVRREALEETGLEVIVKRGQDIRPSSAYRHRGTMAYGFSSPWCSQEIGEHSYLGLFVVCNAGALVGAPNYGEARGHKWVSLGALKRLIEQGRFFPLNVPGLRQYLKTRKSS